MTPPVTSAAAAALAVCVCLQWNATGGANHIWLFAHDEGACWAPTEIYNASIILSQWGRLGPPTTIADGPAGPGSGVGPVMDSWTSK